MYEKICGVGINGIRLLLSSQKSSFMNSKGIASTPNGENYFVVSAAEFIFRREERNLCTAVSQRS